MKKEKRFILILLIIMVQHYMYAQSPQLDSLNILIANASSDTAKIKLLVQKGKLLNIINLDSSMVVFKQALQQANQINYRNGQIELISNVQGLMPEKAILNRQKKL